ncbi:MAG: hypothetical protein ABI221_03350 [Candidatus Saccharimonadales bacterium]
MNVEGPLNHRQYSPDELAALQIDDWRVAFAIAQLEAFANASEQATPPPQGGRLMRVAKYLGRGLCGGSPYMYGMGMIYRIE